MFSMNYRLIKNLIVIFLLFTSACTTNLTPPKNTHNICKVFKEKTHWAYLTEQAFKKWGIPIHIQMAVMQQESGFIADATPPSNFFGLSISSAYGYTQALDGTWDDYLKACKKEAERDNFADACDFIGWYMNESHKKLGISKSDAYNLYLAYHEGNYGYQRKTYLKKEWLLKIAKQVTEKSEQYRKQLADCQKPS